MRKLRHGEISELAKLGQAAELQFDSDNVAPESERRTTQLCCVSYYFIERVVDSLIIITILVVIEFLCAYRRVCVWRGGGGACACLVLVHLLGTTSKEW